MFRINRRKRVTPDVANKTPMEDFLFLLVISLAVSISFFSKKQLADRFALAERRPTTEALAPDDYETLTVVELPDGMGFQLNSMEIASQDELFTQLGTASPSNSPGAGILLRIAYARRFGEVEELKDSLLERGFQVYTEWENRK